MSHDLTFVAPERRDDVRRRIDAIERFLANPGRVMAEKCASDLGLRHAQFYNLVRAWRETGRPEEIMGTKRSRKMEPRIDRGVLNLIDEVIATNPRSPAGQIVKAVADEAAERGIKLPDPSTVSRHVRRRRPAVLTGEGAAGYDLVVDHTVIDIPVDFGGPGVRRPLATMVIYAPAESVMGVALSPGTPSPESTVSALLDAFRHSTFNGNAPMHRPRVGIVAVSDAEGGAAADTLRRAGFDVGYIEVHAHGGGMFIEALLGREHAGLRLKQRLVWNTGERRLAALAPGAKPLTPAEAVDLLRGRLLRGRPTTALGELAAAAREYRDRRGSPHSP